MTHPQEKLAALIEKWRGLQQWPLDGYSDLETLGLLLNELTTLLSEHGEVVVTTDESGRCVAVTRQDSEGRILSTIWEASERGGGGEAFGWWCAKDKRFYRADEPGITPCEHCTPLYTIPKNGGGGEAEPVVWCDSYGNIYPCRESVEKYAKGRVVHPLYTTPPTPTNGGEADHAGYLVDGQDFYYADFPRSEWSKHQSVVPLYLHPPTPSAPVVDDASELHQSLRQLGLTDAWRMENIKETVMNRHSVKKSKRPAVRAVLDEAFQLLREEAALSGVSAPVGVDAEELRRALCQIGIVGNIDGHDVIRRGSMLDIIDRRRAALTPAAAPRGEEPVSDSYKSAASEGDQP